MTAMHRPRLDALRDRRDDILRIAAARGAHDIRVFGSVARREAGPDSDIDFLVDLESERTLFDLSGLILDLEAALGQKVDVIEITRPRRSPGESSVRLFHCERWRPGGRIALPGKSAHAVDYFGPFCSTGDADGIH